MKPTLPLTLLLLSLPAAAVEHLTVIGDSLTKEYEITFPGVPAAGVPGIDVANPGARNWAEILHARRNAQFDSGIFRNNVFDSVNGRWSDLRLLGHESNWAIPGADARTLRLLLTDYDSAELSSDPDLAQFISFAPDWKQMAPRLTTQLQTTSAAFVIWCGANDLRFGNSDPAAKAGSAAIRYQTIYEGDGTGAGNPQPLMDSIKASIQTLALTMKAANPALPVAVCAVPHVGCAPDVKRQWPTDPVRTQRITTALESLNADLKSWTENTLGGAWVDIYPLTKQLISGNTDIGGVTFLNASDTLPSTASTTLHNDYLFSHDGFHSTTTLQARIAQLVHGALRAKYPAKFSSSPELTDREILTSVLGLSVSKGYDDFMAAAAVPAAQRAPDKDPDGDGMLNIMEWILAGNDPASAAASVLPQPGYDTATAAFTLTWNPRYASTAYASVTCQQSSTLSTWTDVPAASITFNAGGTVTARVPASSPLFLRLKVTVTP